MLIRLLAVTLLALAAIATEAHAIDPECTPGDPLYIVPFDPATGDYLRPNRDVFFCSSTLPENPTNTTLDMVCIVSVNGTEYLRATRTQRQVVQGSILAADLGPMSVRCDYDALDQNGDPVTVAGSAVLLVYNPQPIPEPPSPFSEPLPSP